jgi:hypothetical protein
MFCCLQMNSFDLGCTILGIMLLFCLCVWITIRVGVDMVAHDRLNEP